MKSASRARLLLFLGLAVLGGWHLLLRGHGRGLPLITDEGEYSVAARTWAEGGLPYRDAFSQKPPMIFLFYRAASFFSDAPEAPRALAALAALTTLLALFSCAPRTWSPWARLAAPAAFAALSTLPVGDYSFPANTETFVNLFSALAAIALLREAPLAAGLAMGAALCTKQTALWSALGFGVFAAWTARKNATRRAGKYALGFLVVPATWAAYFAARGAFGDYWNCAWAGNARYASILLMTGSLRNQLHWFALTLLPSLVLFSAPALIVATLALRKLRAGPKNPIETLSVLWVGGACAGAFTGLFLFPHYFLPIAPGLALAAACGVERLRSPRRQAAVVAVLALWSALLAPRLIFLCGPRERALRLLYPNPLFETKILGEEIRRRSIPGDRLHVFGSEGALFSYSQLRPATSHTLAYALTLFPKDLAQINKELAALRAAPPRFVVWSTQPLSTMISSNLGLAYRDALRQFLDAQYQYEGCVRVLPTPELPLFEPATSFSPDFDSEDRLLLFTRRALPVPRG